MIGKTEFQFKGKMVRIEVKLDEDGYALLDEGEFTNSHGEWQVDINQGVFVGNERPEPEEPEQEMDMTEEQEMAWAAAYDKYDEAYAEWEYQPYQVLEDVITPHDTRNCYPYWKPPIENYKGIPEAELIKYCIQDWKRVVGYNNGDWCYTGFMVELNGHRESAWGVESDGGEDYHTEVVANLAAELTNDGELIAEIQDRFLDDIYYK